MFAAEIHAIKEAITYALRRDLGELDLFPDSRSALQTLNFLVPRHRAVAEIIDLVKRSNVITHMHWIKAHIGYDYNERADALSNAAANQPSVVVLILLSCKKSSFVTRLQHGSVDGTSRVMTG